MHGLHGIDKLQFLQNPSDLTLRMSNSATPEHRSDLSALSAQSLMCVRGDRTLFDNLNFSVDIGTCLHVIGANGSGKTSLLRIVCGLLRPEQGTLKWHRPDQHDNRSIYSDIAYVGHKDALKNELSAAENLSFYQQMNANEDDDLVDDYLGRLGLLASADLFAHQLSFGQRRRLAFARLLVKKFTLWVLDEPFTGIDTEGRELIEQLCLAHLNNQGMIILTNHQSLQSSTLKAHLQELIL